MEWLQTLRISRIISRLESLGRFFTARGIFICVLGFNWLLYLWETYLSARQYRVYKNAASVPPELIGIMDQTTFNKARAYHLDTAKFSFFCSLVKQFVTTAVLFFEVNYHIWYLSGKTIAHFGYGSEYEITQTLVFVFLASCLNLIIDLPFSAYGNFVIEERHGFNKLTPTFFITDKLKKFLVIMMIALPVSACVVQIVKIGGDYFFLYLWLFSVAITLAANFHKFSKSYKKTWKCEDCKLVKIVKNNANWTQELEDDRELGSKRSAHSNAFFYGFYKNKRIVLFDTLIKDYESKEDKEHSDKQNKGGCNNDEILAVLGHELGHWKLNHNLKNIAIAQVNLLICFSVFALLFKKKVLYAAFGFHTEQPIMIGLLIIILYILAPYDEIHSFLNTALSRHFEYQADAFAKSMNKAADLRGALIKLNKDNLGFPLNDSWYSTWHHSHPSLLERIRALGKID
ncbi:CAAX prenyl protease 1 homolog [Centruroides sculpturatus]|uniref:CAAX prenyl protease 1 homolog n=1 Tax=Centruroides sculpturatus TaxID=218467 RepID=UPI000C6E4FF9|nr:CAAX prenyl protease 1 homolog [Centruroides sculpturatus]